MKDKNNFRIHAACTAGLLILFFAICWNNSLELYGTADFIPINGTFQNYNPVRRFLAGQIPYQDFTDYLGMGHLYAGSLATWILGGSYADSLLAFRFLSLFSFGLIFCVLGYVITRKSNITLAVTNVLLVLVLFRFASGTIQGNMLNDAVTGGNSARFIRSLILPLSCILFTAGIKNTDRLYKAVPKLQSNPNLILTAGLGLVSGAAFIWSNDYGISCWVCGIVMILCILFSRTRSVKATLLYGALGVVCSCVMIYICAQAATLGHFSRWFSSTFGTGSYQSWYYNSEKSYYLLDVDFSFLRLLQALITIIYLIKLWYSHGNKESILRFGLPAFANMVGFCAVNEYKLLSGNPADEMANAILAATILFECIALLLACCKEKRVWNAVVLFSIVVTSAWLGSGLKDWMYHKIIPEYMPEGVYVDALGGTVTGLYEDIIGADEFLQGEKIFSTYASAQEVLSDCFQPSGIDYIIHVLGDETREAYLESFRSDDFRYVTTIKEAYSPWEKWVRHANWFFYRELYQNWHPVYANGYQTYWERNTEENENTIIPDHIDISAETLFDHMIKITIHTDPEINGTADVLIDYAVKEKDRLISKLAFNSMLCLSEKDPAQEEWIARWNLRPENREYIPVTIKNGYGQLYLTGMPEVTSALELNEVRCEQIFTADNYVEVASLKKEADGCVFKIANHADNRNRVESAQYIRAEGKNYMIQEVSEDGTHISIRCTYDGSDIQLEGKFILFAQ